MDGYKAGALLNNLVNTLENQYRPSLPQRRILA
jgi:hypothetical protein